MKKISFKAKITVWITLLITAVCAVSFTGLMLMGRRVASDNTKQFLSSAVISNADEIEFKNGILEAEDDFSFYNDGIYTAIYSESFDYINGELPVSLIDGTGFENGTVQSREKGENSYYMYDMRIDFNRMEYEIDVFSGQITEYEANHSADRPTPAEYKNLEFENGISTAKAIEIALDHAGVPSDEATITAAELTGYTGRQAFRVEFICENSPYDSVWLRGITEAEATADAFDAITNTSVYVLPVFVIIAAAGAYIISRSAVKKIKDITLSAQNISTGSDLSKRIDTGKSRDEIAELAETFNGMFERLHTSFESEKRFTSDASHELRTPLTVIKAECDYALRNGADTEDMREALESVNGQADKMTALVNALLAITRAEQGTDKFHFEQADLSILTKEICTAFSPEKGITLETDIQENITLYMDSTLMSRLIENLLSNAVKYGKENGYIKVSLREEKGKTVLSVKDNGIGIEKEILPKIWERFYRADSARSGSEGFGLGLAFVKRTALMHGAETEVTSAPGEGSEFRIIFSKN